MLPLNLKSIACRYPQGSAKVQTIRNFPAKLTANTLYVNANIIY